jgi:RNA polymerase sigma-70 factor (ECF subfamily)
MKKNRKESGFIDINSELIEACRKGNRKAQFEIYKLYNKAMYNTCFRMLNDKFEAEDVMQESFIKAFSNIEQYRGEVSFGSWLKKIVINKSIDSIRKKRRLAEEPLENQNIDEYIENDEELADKPDIRIIKEEISKLPEGFRLVLSLYLFEGYDHDEIGEILGISASTSRSQYSRARKKLVLNLKRKQDES